MGVSMPAAIIGYIRVSTDKQGKSGLGLEAQREAIARFAAAESLEVAGEFIEVETEKRRRRPGQAPTARRCAS
jgi:DNA invertase Pin-like site-specific DNA recombinase